MNVTHRFILPVVVGLMLTAIPAVAHHSHSATYDERSRITLEGTVVQVLVRNPHSWIHVEAKGEDGEMHRWAGEWGSAAQLLRGGVSGKSFKIGDKVVVVGNPGRNPKDFRFAVVNITRPSDGWSWGFNEGEDSTR